MSRREHGKLAFLTIKDGSGHLQLFAKLDALGDDALRRACSTSTSATSWAPRARCCKTRRGELSLRPTTWQFLSKALRPLPEKFHGLTDVETRYRRRYLDTIVNDDSREVFVKRARIIAAIRRFLDERGFVEVETPILQPLYGGAMARPFVTHHNELKRDLYLRIAVELYLKRCIIGGIDRVYEIGRNFRNEGVSFKHNPEFTMLETYEAYVDYNHVMTMVEELVGAAAAGRRQPHDQLPRPRDRPARRRGRASPCARPSSTAAASTSAPTTRATVAGLQSAIKARGPRRHGAAQAHLGPAGRRALQRDRRAQPHPAGVHHRVPARDQPLRQEDAARPALRRALRGLHRRHGELATPSAS